MIKGDQLFMDVEGLTEETSDLVVPDGETWDIRHFSGSAAYLEDTTVCIVWDPAGTPQILDCTHGDKSGPVSFQAVGDGVKVIRISLQNDSNIPRVLGAAWEGRVI